MGQKLASWLCAQCLLLCIVCSHGMVQRVEPGMPEKLHIGGKTKAPGWLVFDALPAPHVDVVGALPDLSALPSSHFQLVYASHVLEHLSYRRPGLETALGELLRVLAPGGTLALSVPNLQTLGRLMASSDQMSFDDELYTMRIVYGGQMDEFDYHYAGFTPRLLKSALETVGFERVEFVEELGIFDDSSYMKILGTPISLNALARKPQAV
jgi:predicted SAM-dependent methyltransferase